MGLNLAEWSYHPWAPPYFQWLLLRTNRVRGREFSPPTLGSRAALAGPAKELLYGSLACGAIRVVRFLGNFEAQISGEVCAMKPRTRIEVNVILERRYRHDAGNSVGRTVRCGAWSAADGRFT